MRWPFWFCGIHSLRYTVSFSLKCQFFLSNCSASTISFSVSLYERSSKAAGRARLTLNLLGQEQVSSSQAMSQLCFRSLQHFWVGRYLPFEGRVPTVFAHAFSFLNYAFMTFCQKGWKIQTFLTLTKIHSLCMFLNF